MRKIILSLLIAVLLILVPLSPARAMEVPSIENLEFPYEYNIYINETLVFGYNYASVYSCDKPVYIHNTDSNQGYGSIQFTTDTTCKFYVFDDSAEYTDWGVEDNNSGTGIYHPEADMPSHTNGNSLYTWDQIITMVDYDIMDINNDVAFASLNSTFPQ
jgi:hypothetical protein